jgi:MFS family permease
VNRRKVTEFFREIPAVLRTNRGFRNFVVAMVFFVLATISMTFFSVYALAKFRPGETAAGSFTMAMVIAQVVSAPAIGHLGDRKGNKVTLIVAGAAMCGASLWACVAPSLEAFYLVFVCLGINIGSELMARYNITMEFAPEKQRALYLGMLNALLAPFYAVGLIGGWLSNLFGYEPVFLTGAALSLAGIVLMIAVVREPRFSAAAPVQ